MSDQLPTTRFTLELELELDAKPPRAVLSDVTSGKADATPTDVQLDPAPPYALSLALSPEGPAGVLKPRLRAPERPGRARHFDPALVGDDGVLALEWQIRDEELGTQDVTALRLSLANRSLYYQAEDLEIYVEALKPDRSKLDRLPDGNELLSITPEVQSTPQIGPGRTISFDYLVVTRGPQAGLYTLDVRVHYNLVYVYRELCRRTTAVAHLPLLIEGGAVPPMTGGLIPPPSEPQFEHISQPHRRLHMADQTEQNAAAGQSHGREIHPIERRILLPGGGELHMHYRLVKGSYTRPDERRGSFGYNPFTKKIESYFSSLDEAAMEITIRNLSDFHLKHVYLTDVHPFYANDDESPGEPADKDRLPDGNYLFEVLPTELYFGSLVPDEGRTKYLGVVTRGVRPGQFLVRFDVKYEIVNGSARVHLPLSVNPD